MRKPFYLILLSVSTLFTGGCALDGVEAWERQTLTKREMSIINEPLEAATDDHIYFSKEASSGGQSFGGGGCGCN